MNFLPDYYKKIVKMTKKFSREDKNFDTNFFQVWNDFCPNANRLGSVSFPAPPPPTPMIVFATPHAKSLFLFGLMRIV